MKTFEKAMDAITLIVLIVGVVGSIFAADYFAVFGWLSGVVMCILSLDQDSKIQRWEDLFHEAQHEKSVLQSENAELRAQIRELEWEGKDNEN